MTKSTLKVKKLILCSRTILKSKSILESKEKLIVLYKMCRARPKGKVLIQSMQKGDLNTNLHSRPIRPIYIHTKYFKNMFKLHNQID